MTLNGRKVVVPVLMVPGHPDGAVTVYLGFGRRTGVKAGRRRRRVWVSTRISCGLRMRRCMQVARRLTKLDGTYDLCVTKVHNIEHRGSFAQQDLEKPLSDKDGTYSLAGHEAEERSIIRYATLEEVKKNPNFAHEGASGTLVNKVGYLPAGREAGRMTRRFFPDASELQEDRPVFAEDCRTRGACRST